ncbi:DUF4231 domain-containing protein [Plantactinospora sp. B6F1]|uniref:DUF4231 domain-containing protein n=1 Tax=Plantactinospora sp. B6F1 TaxID=3158971 RepID=UPI0032D8E64A
MVQPSGDSEPEIRIAAIEGRLEKARFYLRVIAIWTLLSLVVVISFSATFIAGLGSFSEGAQLICLAIGFLSLLFAVINLKLQRDTVFEAESDLRKMRAIRRGHAAPGRSPGGYDAIRNRYKIESWEYIEESRRSAASNRRIHNTFQAAIILGSIVVTSLTSAMASSSPLNWITVVVSVLVSASAGLSSYFKFRERGFNLQQTANAVEKEYNSVELRIHDYGQYADDDEAAMRLFAERVEALKEEQRNRELQLEQSPERTSSSHDAVGSQV